MSRRTLLPISIFLLIILTGGLLYLVSHQPHPSASTVTPPLCPTISPNGVLTMNQPTCTHQRILIFSKTAGYRHDSIPAATASLKTLASEHHIEADSTEDSSVFTPENLARYNVVIFLMTSGHLLDTAQQQAFEHYIHSGGGYVGIHSASDTEYAWSWYGQLVGAFFKDHPHITQATLTVEDPTTISTNMLPAHWTRTDEWYNFRTNPRKNVYVLLTVDETSYTGGTMGRDHPISWYHSFEGGRSWYTAMGHASAYYHEPLFLAHIWGGILYAGNLHS